MDFIHEFGMEFNPFIKNDSLDLVQTKDHREMLSRLNYLTEIKGIGVFYGNPGAGKTTTLRKYVHELNEMLYKVIYITLSTITVHEFYRILAEELGLESYSRKSTNFKCIQEEITRLQKEKRITPVIIIDEAQYLKTEILNDLKMLFNFEMDSVNRAVLILNGTPNLASILNKPVHEALKQRIVISYDFEGVTLKEVKEYIDYQLKTSKCISNIMQENAYEAIYNSSNGSLRVVNDVMNKCLMISSNMQNPIINTDVVMQACNDRQLG